MSVLNLDQGIWSYCLFWIWIRVSEVIVCSESGSEYLRRLAYSYAPNLSDSNFWGIFSKNCLALRIEFLADVAQCLLCVRHKVAHELAGSIHYILPARPSSVTVTVTPQAMELALWSVTVRAVSETIATNSWRCLYGWIKIAWESQCLRGELCWTRCRILSTRCWRLLSDFKVSTQWSTRLLKTSQKKPGLLNSYPLPAARCKL